PRIETERHGSVEQVWATATHDPATGAVTVLLANRSLDEDIEVAVDLSGLGDPALVEHLQVHTDNASEVNTADDPDRVRPHAGTSRIEDGILTIAAPAVSWHCVRLTEGKQDA